MTKDARTRAPSDHKNQAGGDGPSSSLRSRPKPAITLKKDTGKTTSLPVFNKAMTSTPAKSPLKTQPESETKLVSPILTKLSSLISRDGGMGPLTNLIPSSDISSTSLLSASTSVLPEPIHDTVGLIHEELNETKRSLQMLRSNAQHLLLSPDNVVSSLETCIADVEKLNNNVVKLHDMLSARFEQLENIITSLPTVPDPTEPILEGVAALLANMTPAPKPQPSPEYVAKTEESLSLLMKRMEKLENSCSKTCHTTSEILGRTDAFLDNIEKERTIQVTAPAPTPSNPVKPYVSLVQFDGLTPEQLQAVDEFLKTVTWKKAKGGRELYYCGDCGYGYGPMNHPKNPIPKALIPLIDAMNKANPGHRVNTILFTRYANGTIGCPAHFDDEPELSPTDHILTWSRGPATRAMRFTNVHTGVTTDLPLPTNSLLTVSRESQTTWKHEIPLDEEVADMRESATFRMIRHENRYHTRLYGDSNTGFIKFGAGPDNMGPRFPGNRIRVPRVGDLPEPADVPPVPKLIFHVGINDLVDPVSPISCEEIALTMDRKCAAILRKLPKTKILISPLLPTINRFLNQQVQETNRLIFDVCAKYHNVIMMDSTPFMDPDGLLLERFRGKRPENVVHLNGHGIRALKDLFKGYIVGRAPMRGMNYKSALIGGPSAQDTGCPSNSITTNRRFIRDDVNVIDRPHNMMNIGNRGPACDRMVAGGSSGWLMGRSNSGGTRSSGPRRFERQDTVKVDRRNQKFRPRVNPRVSNGHRESGFRDFRRKWDSSVNGFVEFGGTGISQSHSQSHHDGGK